MSGVRSILHTIRSLALYNQAQCCLLDGCRTHGAKPMQRRGLCTSGATTRTRRAGRCSCASMRCWIGSMPTSGASCCCPKSSIVACKRRPQPPGSFCVGEVLLPLRGRVPVCGSTAARPCDLSARRYNEGYTSLGGVSTTARHPALVAGGSAAAAHERAPAVDSSLGGSGPFLPAYMLPGSEVERQGRVQPEALAKAT